MKAGLLARLLIAPATALLVTLGMQAAGAQTPSPTATSTATSTATATATVTATVTPGFTGTVPADGSIGLLVTQGVTSGPVLANLLPAAGCEVESLGIIQSGTWYIYVNGAPAIVNAAFPTALADRTAFFVRCR